MQGAPVGHPDPLGEPERLSRPFLASLVLHGGLAGLFLVSAVIKSTTIPIGEPNPGAGVNVTPVKTIPIPAKQGQINPVANDTESVVPQEPLKLEQQRPQQVTPPPKAIRVVSR